MNEEDAKFADSLLELAVQPILHMRVLVTGRIQVARNGRFFDGEVIWEWEDVPVITAG